MCFLDIQDMSTIQKKVCHSCIRRKDYLVCTKPMLTHLFVFWENSVSGAKAHVMSEPEWKWGCGLKTNFMEANFDAECTICIQSVARKLQKLPKLSEDMGMVRHMIIAVMCVPKWSKVIVNQQLCHTDTGQCCLVTTLSIVVCWEKKLAIANYQLMILSQYFPMLALAHQLIMPHHTTPY